ncbi:MAG: hypothetical protein WCJ37_13120 [Syntrophus sp. (in: bacteria)]
MSYIKPDMVLSPKKLVSNIRVLFDSGEEGWSAVELEWDGEPAIGLRWNGGSNADRPLGNPQSRGVPTWFIVPDEIAKFVKANFVKKEESKLVTTKDK